VSFYNGTPPISGGVNTWTSVYTVPVGHVIKLANIAIHNAAATSKGYNVRVGSSLVIVQGSQASLATLNVLTAIVLTAGEDLQVEQVPGVTNNYFLSGYIFYV
jgi:hypothetical protein